MASRKLFTRYRYDLSLEEGVGSSMLMWVIALMVFLATLGLALGLSLNSLTKFWNQGLTGRVTIEIAHPMDDSQPAHAEFQSRLREIEKRLQETDSVKSARLLQQREIESLIEPWLGRKTA